VEDAEYVAVAVGVPARVCKDAVTKLRAQGERVGLLRPKIIWPFPFKGFKALHDENPGVKAFFSVEGTDLGMMVEDVALAVKKSGYVSPVYCYAYSGGTPRVKNVIAEYEAIKNGERDARF
jgi:2-oxoglutarate ferredoxin oxidoreductase subunit alpha